MTQYEKLCQNFEQLLDQIFTIQKALIICHSLYLDEEKKLEEKLNLSPDSMTHQSFQEEIERLNKEYEEKVEEQQVKLSQHLVKGSDLAHLLGGAISYDYKMLWDDLANPKAKEIDLPHLAREIETIKKDLKKI